MIDYSKFHRIYANLPLGIRTEIVCVIDGEPITWKVAFIEINNNTKIAEKIMDQLIKSEII